MKEEPDSESLMAEIKKVFGEADDIQSHVAYILASGPNTIDDVIKVYANFAAAVEAIPSQL